MDRVRLGAALRALRLRKGWRQADLADAAGSTRTAVWLVERGMADRVRVGDLLRMAEALGADLDVRIRWHGEGLDRVLDRAHATLVDATVAILGGLGWDVAVEVSFSKWGERGSIDILAFNARAGTVLVVEVKSVIPDAQSMLFALDRKARLASEIARDRGWASGHTARLLVVGESSTSRRRVSALDETFRIAFPQRGRAVRRWLREPDGPISGLLFLQDAAGGRTIARSARAQRIRKRGVRADRPRVPASEADGNVRGAGPG